MLKVSQLSFAYNGIAALDNVTLAVERGKVAALLGPNGAGKSTLMSIITGQFAAKSGHVTIDGRDVARQRPQALKATGIVFQSPTLDLDLTVAQNLSYFGGLQGMTPGGALESATPWLDRFELAERRNDKVRILSGGQRRRVEIIRALLHDPKLLLLDEPTTGLDVPTRQSIVRLVHELAAEKQVSVLWATHLVDEVYETDDLVVLQNGRVIDTGLCTDVMDRMGKSDLAAIAGGSGPTDQLAGRTS